MTGALIMILSSGCSNLLSPDRPRNVDATPLSQHVIQVTWTCDDEEYYDFWGNQSGDAVSYSVYRDGRLVADVGDLDYLDRKLSPDTLYCYRITSYWDENIYDWIFHQESVKSQEACAWTYPLNTISGTVILSATGFEGVYVELVRSTGFPAVLATTTTDSGGDFSFTDLENFMFTPGQYQFNLVNQNAYGVDFSAVPSP
jgi:hypothetical protein